MKVGNFVKPTKESGYILRDSLFQHNEAIVISVEPFVLVSTDTYMRWSATVVKEDFEVLGNAPTDLLKKCMRRINS